MRPFCWNSDICLRNMSLKKSSETGWSKTASHPCTAKSNIPFLSSSGNSGMRRRYTAESLGTWIAFCPVCQCQPDTMHTRRTRGRVCRGVFCLISGKKWWKAWTEYVWQITIAQIELIDAAENQKLGPCWLPAERTDKTAGWLIVCYIIAFYSVE